MILRLIWLVLLTVIWGYASPLQLGNANNYSVQGHLSYLEDPTGALQISEIKQSQFLPYQGNSVNFGFTKSAYWFKIEIKREIQSGHQKWWLMIPYPLLEKIDVYFMDKEGELLSYQTLGSSVPFVARELPLRNFMTELPLYQESDATLIIRVQTQSSMQVPISIYSSKGLFQEVETNNLKVGLYYGIYLIIFLYNVGIYFYTKDRNYLRYILFLTSFILWQLSFDGIGREYLWPNSQWFIYHFSAVLIAFTAFSALNFGRNFLSTRLHFPKIDKVILALMGISLLLVVCSLLLPYSSVIGYNTLLTSIVPALLLGVGIAVIRKGYRPARFYIAGWSSFFIGTIIFAFNKFDLIPNFYGVNHIQQIGSAIEMIFLSWALADRVHLLQGEYIDKLNHLNDTLSEKVREGLEEARSKDRLLALQSRHAAMGEMIEQIAHQWRQPLNTLGLINQDLYFKRHLGNCDEVCYDKAHEQFEEHLHYMSKTIDDFRNYYKMDKTEMPEDIGELASIAFRLNEVLLKYSRIQTHLIVETSTKVMITKNEMIQVLINLIKNAHDVIKERHIESGEITITVLETRGWVKILVEDNGGGIEESAMKKIFDIYFTTKSDDKGTGLGLYMCRNIVEESFGGTIGVENTAKGARFTISLPIERTDIDVILKGKNS
ncbi:MAG: sensor histidine kinase [Campylobacterales bacterium]|nr:sensor histidine kinase [Campylobacterales bacterium]